MRHHKREPLTREEANRLAVACKTGREKLVVWTLLDTGLRVEEFCNLDKNNIDWDRHAVVVWGKNTTGEGGKKRRVVNLSDRCKPLLEGHFAMNDIIGMTVRTANRIVHTVAKRADIRRPCSPHILRHTYAVTMVRKGISLVTLKLMMGHERLATTEIYLNLQPEEALREVQEKW